MTGRFALAALLIIGCGLNAVAANSPTISAEARAAAAQTELLPPPAPLADSTVAAAQRPAGEVPLSNLRRGDFVRAVWVDAGDPALQSNEAIRKVVADCRVAGFNTIHALVRSGGTAACQTDLSPRAHTASAGFDPLAVLLAECQAGAGAPVAVHAWLKMASVGAPQGSDPRAHAAALHPDWLTRSSNQKAALWLDPASPEVRQHLAEVAAEVARRYAVTGLVLEDAGYAPALDTGYHPAALQRFQSETRATSLPTPADAKWIEWRRVQAAECVRQIRQAVRAVRPTAVVTLLAEVDGPAPADRATYAHAAAGLKRPLDAWPVLAETASVDAILLSAPQGASAAAEASALEEWTAFALQAKGAARLTVGVQARPKDAKYTAAMMLDPILEPRTDGVAVLPGMEAPSRMESSIYKQLFDPTLVEAHAQRLLTTAAAGVGAKEAGLPRLAGRERMSLSGAPAPVNTAYLQAADATAPPPAGGALPALPPLPGPGAGAPPNALPPLSTPAPIGADATSLPPVPAPAPPAATPAVPPALAPDPDNQLPMPPLSASDAPPALPPVTAPPPADAPVPALPPLVPPGLGEPAVALPPLAPLDAPVPAPLPPPGAPPLPPPGASVSIPSMNDLTNFNGAPIAGPVRVAPTITPPTIRPAAPVLTGAEALPLGQRAAIAAPQFAIPDFSDPESVFVPRVPPPILRDYAPPPVRPTDVDNPVPADQLEVIVMNTGKEFVGRVLERGLFYRIQMPNGGIVRLEAARVATVRAATKPLDVKPLE